jgi:hypothetical protein
VWAVLVVDNGQFLVASINTTDTDSAQGLGATASVEQQKELTMLADAFAVTRQATVISGGKVQGWNESDDAAVRSRQALVQMRSGDYAAERVMVFSRAGEAPLVVEKVPVTADVPGTAIMVKTAPAISGG